MLPKISDNAAVQAAYEQMRANGQSHSIAEMCALRTPCGANNTERAFFEGHHNGSEFSRDESFGNYAKRKAIRAGVDVTGKRYIAQLADEVADPKAWVSDLHDVKRRAEELGASCSGAVTVKAPQYTPDEVLPKVAPDLVQAEVSRRLQKNPELAILHKPQELTEMVTADIAPA